MSRPAAVLAFVLVLLALPARADWLLKLQTDPVRAGSNVDVLVYLVNDTDAPIAGGLPAKLPATAVSANHPAAITLEAVAPPAALGAPIAPGAFRKQLYRARLPDELVGPVQIELDRLPSARLQMVVEAHPGSVLADTRVDTVPEPILSPHEPIYFLFGTREANTARFQLSLKYRLFDERGSLAQLVPGLGKLHFGYTQTSLWDIGATSAPFRDTSYRPSLFWFDPQVRASADGRHLFGVEAGVEHESNGRDGVRSRSLNVAYVRPSWRWFVDDEHYFVFAPKLYGYLDTADNADIARYRGYADLNLRYGKRDGWLFSGTVRRGTGGYGSLQLDASYPLRRPFFANAGGYVHLQYFGGYGETLLDYNLRRSAQFRIGFSIVR